MSLRGGVVFRRALKPLASLTAGFLVVFAVVGSAAGATFNYVAHGIVDDVGGNTSPIAIGQTFTATWSVDSTVAARTGSTSNQAVFDALLSLNVSIGTYSASTPGPQEIQVDHDVAGFDDRYGIVSTSFSGLTGPLNGSDLNLFFLNLKDSSKTVFSDALILPLALSLASFDSTAFAFFFSDDSFISGHLTDLSSVSPVPLPAALPLFASALGAMSFLGWRRKRKAAALAAANV